VGIVDWALIIAYAIVMLGIGAYYSRANQSADDYLLGGRRMPSIMVGLSLFATLMSTLSYLAHPGEMIAHGPMLITQGAAHPLIFVIVGYGLIPLLMRQPVTSAYELLEKRLGLGIRRAGAGVFLLLRLGWMATILYATSKVVLVPGNGRVDRNLLFLGRYPRRGSNRRVAVAHDDQRRSADVGDCQLEDGRRIGLVARSMARALANA
jgi:SSS family solute:Na+ symporter